MKNLILVDGNNLMFRAFYATAYTGNLMKNKEGLPTNALYGFVSMLNKIIAEEQPEYMAVAFDIGKNFRKEKYDFYKDGRIQMPEELKIQMPIAREILEYMGITYLELAPYEADDIIGTIVKMTEEDENFKSVIVSSDKDLLQLISKETEVKLLKQTGHIRYNLEAFKEDWKIDPIRIIDLKALMGDPSDNIPGVKGIGEKTALKLLQEYESLENIYEHIDEIKGKTKEKLLNDKDNAFMSKEIATIYKDVPLKIKLEYLQYTKTINKDLQILFKELGFLSFLKNMEKPLETKNIEYKSITSLDELILEDKIAIHLELDSENYHTANIIGLGISDSKNNYFIDSNLAKDAIEKVKDYNIITYDAKKIICHTKIEIHATFDLMIAAYLLNYNIKDDIAYLANQGNEEFIYSDQLKKESNREVIEKEICKRSCYIYHEKEFIEKELGKESCLNLFNNIEMPLVYVLASMEMEGIKAQKEVLDEMHEELEVKIELLTKEIYNLAGMEFNIASPRQLGEVLFEHLALAKGTKNKTGYKTDAKVLEKLIGKHPIIEKILEYRNLTKLNSTYIQGLVPYILSDGKIHTIYKQTLTRTGRLSSTEPNLQNIPIREELGRKIRKAFVPCNDLLLSADYSQIELRILAHISGSAGLIDAFKHDADIHTRVASEIHGINESEVTKTMRRTAKAVIFGIVYGISGFGLGENLHISKQDADDFIQRYFELYPKVKEYMDETVKNARKNGYVTTLFGRKRIIEEIKNPNYLIRSMGERMAMNTPIQGTSADIMKMAMINVYKRFQKENFKSKILLQVHDEIIVDVDKTELEQVSKAIKEEMENAYKLEVPLKVEIDTGTNWYETK